MRVAIGSILAGLVGALVVVFVSLFQGWTNGVFSQVIAGLVIGGAPGLLLGWCLAMQGGGLAGSEQKSDSAPAWGLITGVVYGLALGPAFCAAAGVCLGLLFDLWGWNNLGQSLGGDLLVQGGIIGLYLGPIVSILAWEAAFFLGSADPAGERANH